MSMLVAHHLTVREEIDALEAAARPRPVLGLDPGKRCGVALVRGGQVLYAMDYDMRDDWDADIGRALHLFQAFLAGQIAEHKPRLIAIERPAGMAQQSRDMPVTVANVALMTAYAHGTPSRLLAVSTIRKRALGNGRLSKEEAGAELKRRGLGGKNGHARDAIACALAAEVGR